MKKRKTKNTYALRGGMVLEREFYGRIHRLEVVSRSGSLEFKLGDQVFASLTAAAKHVCGDETRTISGPQFWRAPLA
jgi:hypothetical protein